MTTSSQLITQINALQVPPGSLALWALGQSGFVLKGGEIIVYIDPYLSNYVDEAGYAPPGTFPRQFPAPLLPEEVTNAQVVFCTHEHADHTDPKTVAPLHKASPQAVFVGPPQSFDILYEVGVPSDLIDIPPVDKPLTVGQLTYTAIPAAHYDLDYDPQRGYRWLGFVIELNGVTLYHAGDTILYDGLVDRLKRHRIDVACLPVNGRDWWREQRGMIGNLDAHEAAELAATIGADVLIPMHNDMFAANHASPAGLADFLDRTYPRQKYHWLQPGELYFYVKS
ncbi:MAG: MBL fold metallo-hydrolase [Chloroflexi bacterium]|nr:MBL fold metallo-hydrolase [Chloroflexota bacterium]MCI0578209.1 MBL fold metallo-hydrolase [Chloroflexota bacterium]MCI0645298.1 MBL fold metallo-hydrolase [Chloroflexota bacterium]MCI0729548.1 MBL fold metallo-hydrolase [Chloroflexota bacterium]